MSDVFQDPKPGDEVALYRYMVTTPTRATIEKVLPTQVVVGGNKYMRKSGYEVGGGYSKRHVGPWTPQIDARIAADLARAAVDALYKRLSAAVEVAKFLPRGGQRPWTGPHDLDRLGAFVAGIEASVADLVGAVSVGATP